MTSVQRVEQLGLLHCRLLHYFLAVAEELSFSKAAQRLHMSQPPLSLHIKELEDRLGIRLLQRTTRSVQLTAAGHELLAEVRAMEGQLLSTVQQIQQMGRGQAGQLQLGVVGTALWGGLLDALSRYAAVCPAVTWGMLELAPAAQQLALQQQRIDLAFWREAPANPLPGLHYSLFERENIVLAVPAKHALAARQAVEWAELAGEDFVLLTQVDGGLGRYLYAACCRHGFAPRLRLQLAEPQSILAVVAQAYGVSLLPACYARIAWPGVCFVDLASPLSADLYAVYRRDELSPVAQAFLQWRQAEVDGDSHVVA